jgi:hypothetical protein
MKQQEPFTIRTYGKSELAMIYFPKLSKKSAVRKLRSWILTNPRLQRMIEPKAHDLTPKQVKAIVGELGEP